MAAAEVDLVVDTPERIRFAHSPWKALAFMLVSVGFTLVCWFTIQDSDAARYGFTAFSLIFVAAGLAGVFWRFELDIDLVRREIRRVRGMWPNPKAMVRNLNEADGIWLGMRYRSSGSGKSRRKVPWWFVSLKFPEEKKGTVLFTTRREVEGYRKWEYYAGRLGLAAVDDTAERQMRKAPDELDENLGATADDKGNGAPSRPVRPLNSKARVAVDRGHRSIVLPPLGVSGGLVFLVLFGGAFVAMGGSVLLASLGFIDMQVNGSPWVIRIVPPVFVLVGLGIIWLGIRGSFSSLVLGVERGELYTEQLAFGKRTGRECVRLSEIESIEVAGDVGARRKRGAYVKIGGMRFGTSNYRERESEVVVRSDEKILRFGRFLPEAEKEWLADVCRFATHHGELA